LDALLDDVNDNGCVVGAMEYNGGYDDYFYMSVRTASGKRVFAILAYIAIYAIMMIMTVMTRISWINCHNTRK